MKIDGSEFQFPMLIVGCVLGRPTLGGMRVPSSGDEYICGPQARVQAMTTDKYRQQVFLDASKLSANFPFFNSSLL